MVLLYYTDNSAVVDQQHDCADKRLVAPATQRTGVCSQPNSATNDLKINKEATTTDAQHGSSNDSAGIGASVLIPDALPFPVND